jgi:uncharacterized membrane protein
VSGGSGSLVPWTSLGAEGRLFTAGAVSTDALRTFRPGSEPLAPIRVFIGLQNAPDAAARADLAVKELERTGAFQRKYLVVWTVTGTGWVDPVAAAGLEYAAGGDTAIAAQQYSYLPSWISFLVDKDEAAEAGTALYTAVHDRWSQLAPEARPELLLFGESLGSFGGETAFSGEQSMANLTDGVLFAGPPNFNPLFREFSDHRDTGSLEVQPVYHDGRIVRFADDATKDIPPDGKSWPASRALYMMHPSDPIVWWDWSLMLHKPDWTSEPPGPDALKETIWVPFLTFWQVTGDLPFATGVPPGHGHSYKTEYVDGWNAVMRTNLPQDQLANLREVISGVNQD